MGKLDKFKKPESKPAKSTDKKGAKKGAEALDLNKLAQNLSDKYGVDVGTILELLLQWGPKIVDLVLALFKKTPKGSMGCCPDMVKSHLDSIIKSQSEALATSLCLKHCVDCCEDDNEETE